MLVLLALLACTETPPDAPVSSPPVPVPPVVEVAVAAPEPSERRYAASHVLVAWKGAVGASAVTRTEAEASAVAEAVRKRALAGEDFAALARETSDSPTGRRGGTVGVYLTGTMVPDFERAVAGVAIGEIAPVVRTPFGYHVIRRDPIVEARAAHVLVAWSGTPRSQVTRSKVDAKARAEEALAKLDAGVAFEQVARDFSDDPSGQVGGDLGVIAPGQMVPAFEEALFALEPGHTSRLVETVYGWHVIRRAP